MTIFALIYDRIRTILDMVIDIIRIIHSNLSNYNLLVGFFCVVTMFISVSSEFHHDGDSLNISGENLKRFQVSSLTFFAILIPLAIDLLMDFVTESNTKDKLEYWISRFILVSVAFIVGILFIGQANQWFQFFHCTGASFYLTLQSYTIILVSVLCYTVCNLQPVICTPLQTILGNLIFCSILELKYYATVVNPVLLEPLSYFIYVSVVIGGCIGCNWIFKFYQRRQKLVIDDYKCIFYVSLTFACFLLLSFNYIYDQAISQNVDASLSVYFLSGIHLVLSIIPGKVAKFEAIAAKDKIIETKKAYVRYISHELRNPLNIVFTGIKLAIDQIPSDSKVASDIEQLSVLEDTSSACLAALDILNDLLLYDKLETESLKLNRQEFKVIDYFTTCLKIYKNEVKDKKINIKIIKNNSLSYDDKFVIDKNKFSQVIRNLTSNAIKFSPEGGDITISLSFIPNESDKLNNEEVKLSDHPNSSKSYKSIQVKSKTVDNKVYDENLIAAEDNSCKFLEAAEINGTLIAEIKDSGVYSANNYDDTEIFPSEKYRFMPEILHGRGESGLGMIISKKLVTLHGGTIASGENYDSSGSIIRIEMPMTRNSILHNQITHEYETTIDVFNESYQLAGFPQTPMVVNSNDIRIHKHLNEDVICINNNFSKSKLVSSYSIENLCVHAFQKSYDKNLTNIDDSQSNATNSKVFTYTDINGNRNESFHGSGVYILIVDDSTVNRKMLSRLLKLKGCRIEEAEDGLIALNMVKSKYAIDHENIEMSVNNNFDEVNEQVAFSESNALHHQNNLHYESKEKSLCNDINQYVNIETPSQLENQVSGTVFNYDSDRTSFIKNNSNRDICKEVTPPRSMDMNDWESVKEKYNLYDCILMDYSMPNMKGPTATEEIIKLGYQGPIIGITGNLIEDDVDYFIRAGAVRVLAKPLNIESLLQTMIGNTL